MEGGWVWAAGGGILLAVLFVLRRPLGLLLRLALRSGGGMCALWLFNLLGEAVGIRLGVNPVGGLALGVLGAPGLGLLLMLRWLLI